MDNTYNKRYLGLLAGNCKNSHTNKSTVVTRDPWLQIHVLLSHDVYFRISLRITLSLGDTSIIASSICCSIVRQEKSTFDCRARSAEVLEVTRVFLCKAEVHNSNESPARFVANVPKYILASHIFFSHELRKLIKEGHLLLLLSSH